MKEICDKIKLQRKERVLKEKTSKLFTDEDGEKEFYQQVDDESTEAHDFSTESRDAGSQIYCKQNRWNSFDCTLCKVILPSMGAYKKHS